MEAFFALEFDSQIMKKVFYVILSMLSFAASAQTTGSIVGKLLDREMNDEPLPFANILIKGTTRELPQTLMDYIG